MYGNDLSSRSRTLNGGRCRLTRFCSRWSASTSLPVTITSTSATRSGQLPDPDAAVAARWKYERTRERSDFALPTYRTSPSAVAEQVDARLRRQALQLRIHASLHAPSYGTFRRHVG